jgi:hypothetical protein
MDRYPSVSDQRDDPCGAFEQAMGLSHSVRYLVEHWIAKDVWTPEMTHKILLQYKPMREVPISTDDNSDQADIYWGVRAIEARLVVRGMTLELAVGKDKEIADLVFRLDQCVHDEEACLARGLGFRLTAGRRLSRLQVALRLRGRLRGHDRGNDPGSMAKMLAILSAAGGSKQKSVSWGNRSVRFSKLLDVNTVITTLLVSFEDLFTAIDEIEEMLQVPQYKAYWSDTIALD